MAKVGLSNIKHNSPKWIVNLTGVLAIITPILPSLVQTMPGSISAETKDWILWIMSVLTGISATAAMLSKSNKIHAS